MKYISQSSHNSLQSFLHKPHLVGSAAIQKTEGEKYTLTRLRQDKDPLIKKHYYI